MRANKFSNQLRRAMVRDERYPLLYVLDESGEPYPETRNMTASRGAVALLRQWPSHITTPLTFVLVILGSATVLTLVLLLALNAAYLAESEKHKTDMPIGCDTITRQPIVPFASHAMFFLAETNQGVNEMQLCAIESVALSNPDSEIFYIQLLPSHKQRIQTENILKIEILANSYENIKMLSIQEEAYLLSSPFHLHNQVNSSDEMLSRLLALWHFGGVTTNWNLITVKNGSLNKVFSLLKNDKVLITSDGTSVVAAPEQCHAFIFDLLKHFRKHAHNNMFDLVHHECSNNGTCPSVQYMPDELLCGGDDGNITADCLWKPYNKTMQKYCPQTKFSLTVV